MIIDELKAYRKERFALESLQERMKRLRSSMERITVINERREGGRGTPNKDQLLDNMAHLEEIELAISTKIIEQEMRMWEIEKAIESLENPLQQIVIRFYYIDGLKWKEVMKKMNYERTQIWRIHHKALVNVVNNKIWNTMEH